MSVAAAGQAREAPGRAELQVRGLAAPPRLAVPSATGVPAGVVLAGPGARAMAFMVDWLLRAALTVVYLLIASLLLLGDLSLEARTPEQATNWYLYGGVPALGIFFFYHYILEPVMGGRTPGKRMAGIRILTQEGLVPSTAALITRNVFRLIDGMPGLYVVGLLFVFFGKRHLRLGDIAAGTVLAVERAPFLEKLAAQQGQPASRWTSIRQRAAALRRRRGSEVAEALDIVREYGRAASALNTTAASALNTTAASALNTTAASAPNTTAASAQTTPAPRDAELLEATYADLHDIIHRPARRHGQVLLALFRDRIPAALQVMRVHLLAVTLLFITSAVVGAWLVFTYPDLIALFASRGLIDTVERGELWTEGMLNVAPAAVHSMDILTNNIVVSLFAFCSGIIFGLGTLYIIATNGLSIGALFAFTGQHGLAGGLFDFVIAHGCVELSCICIAGAAGAYLGESLVRPRERTRADAFRAAASLTIRVMLAVTLLLVGCGFIEGYISPDPDVPRWARIIIGVGYWLFMLSFLRGYVFGRSRGGPPINS